MYFIWKFLIIESHPDFAEITIVEGVTAAPVEEQCAIFIGHMGEFHYLSTDPLTSSSSITQWQNKQNVVKPEANLSSFHMWHLFWSPQKKLVFPVVLKGISRIIA